MYQFDLSALPAAVPEQEPAQSNGFVTAVQAENPVEAVEIGAWPAEPDRLCNRET